jgi:hypothetical protein
VLRWGRRFDVSQMPYLRTRGPRRLSLAGWELFEDLLGNVFQQQFAIIVG